MNNTTQTKVKHTPTHYYEWGNEKSGSVSVGAYVNDVWKGLGQMEKIEAITIGLTFKCPYP